MKPAIPILTLSNSYEVPVRAESYRAMLADRLSHLRREHLLPKATSMWPHTRQIVSFTELNPTREHSLQEDVILFGILLVNPSQRQTAIKTYRTILDPLSKSVPRDKLVMATDPYFIEDGGIRLQLDVIAVSREQLIPGAVVAVKGRFPASDLFKVVSLIHAVDTSVPTPLPQSANLWTDSSVNLALFVSGLVLGWEAQNTSRALLLATSLGLPALSSVQQVVLCGGTYAPVEDSPAAAACLDTALSLTALFLDLQASYDLTDTVLARIAMTKPMLIMPGQTDPTPRLWPQDPIPELIIPRTVLTENIVCAPCPAHLSTADGRQVYIIDGTALSYLEALIQVDVDVQTLVCFILQASHLCPHAPLFFDTQPLAKDTFVFTEPPNCIIVAGYAKTKLPELYTVELLWKGSSSLCTIAILPEFASTDVSLAWDLGTRWSTFTTTT